MRYPAILAAGLIGAATVLAAPAAAETTIAVKYADLDLSTGEGQRQLDRRIDSAAREVCGMNDVATGTRLASRVAKQCLTETKARMHERVVAAAAQGSSRG